ncbi:MAG: precorrin-6A/cobalt-precorrin-6A reductase [Erysipelotrichales bacterium]
MIREFVELDNAIFFDDYSQLTHYLNENDGNALVTTGSKAIIPYTLVNDYKERLFFRVLPMIASLEQCYRYGIKGSHIIAMQGPFSIDLNKALLKQYNCQYLISKNTGKSGGMEEKLQATKEMDIKLLIVSLEQEQGYRIDDMIEILENI